MSRIGRTSDQLSEARRLVADADRRVSACSAEMDRLRQAFDALPVGVVVADPLGVIRATNAAYRQIGGHAKVLVAEAVERHLRRAIDGQPSDGDVEFFGPPRTVLRVAAVPTSEGGAVATIEDISERVRVDAVRTDFVANISHELKTPIGAMAVLAETLTDVDEHVDVERLAGRIAEEAHRATSTIDDLLELSRIELGGPALDEVVDIDALIADVVERARTAAEQRAIRISAPRHDGLTVVGDSRQLASALSNLVDNAIKYSDEEGLVEIDAVVEASTMVLTVADRGIGIPATDLGRIFERFYRVDRARSRGTGGTGLGLAIVRHVATNHGGEVTVSSHEGEGSTFTLRIPTRKGLP